MSELQVRGYIISSTMTYLREKAGHDGAARALEGLSRDHKELFGELKPAEWYPVSLVAALNRTIASVLGKDEDERAREALISCGRYMAREATNTFLRLVMRMLTPAMFAKKLPDFWRRDCNGGRLVVDVDDQRFKCQYFEVPGFDHVGVVAIGFASFALETMGKSIDRTVLHGWSIATPNPDGVSFELFWKK